MNVAVDQGESGGASVRAFPSFGILLAGALALCTLLIWPQAAQAGGIYRCTGAQGEAVFTSHAAGYRHCRAVHGVSSASARHVARPKTRKASTRHEAEGGHWTYHQARAGETLPQPHGTRHTGTRVLRGAVYRVRRDDGSIEYTNVRPRGKAARSAQTLFTYIATCVACDVRSNIDWHTVPLNMTAYTGAIRRASTDYGVSAALLRAVIHAESAFNPRALSSKGAQGLMQLMPDTASNMGINNPFDATQNIRGGAHYLSELLKDFHGDIRLAAAAYNAGPKAVRKYGGVPPYPETRVYVRRVAILAKRYASALGTQSLALDSGPTS